VSCAETRDALLKKSKHPIAAIRGRAFLKIILGI
jgi:hypothetical protein